MARYNIIVLSNPVSGREAEFDTWYTNTHILDLLKVPGFKTAQRFRVMDALSNGARQSYVAQYEVETDNINATMGVVQSRLGTPQMPMTEAFDMTSAAFLVVEPITDKIAAK